MSERRKIAIVGGGAAGFFCAINAAIFAKEQGQDVDIKIFEATSKYLKKVKISGGGRCNVTHNIFNVRDFCDHYPRGQRELLSPMQNFQAQDTVKWFQDKGVSLVAEEDGRMFPTSNKSETIIECYQRLADEYNIERLSNHNVSHIEKGSEGTLVLHMKKTEETFECDSVLIATGSSNKGYDLAESLGHTITERAPSLFSFKIQDELIKDLPGLSFDVSVTLTLPNKQKFKQRGPLLITHWGLSGPAILKLSAWAAREMKNADYKARLFVNWLGQYTGEDLQKEISKLKDTESKTQIKNTPLARVPKRFWTTILSTHKIDENKQWANLSKKEMQKIVQTLTASEFMVEGKNRYKDEFVECGGVKLTEIDFKTMQSKKCKNLYFAGEVLDIDGITGGFNFQNAWTTGWLAARDMVVQCKPNFPSSR